MRYRGPYTISMETSDDNELGRAKFYTKRGALKALNRYIAILVRRGYVYDPATGYFCKAQTDKPQA